MITVSEILRKHPLVLIKLGATDDNYRFVPERVHKYTVLVCPDATGTPRKPGYFRQTILINRVVANSAVPREFIERAWWDCSSLIEAKRELVRKYAVEAYYAEKSRTLVTPVTVPEILTANGLTGFDVLMTDLEGMDLPVIKDRDAFLGVATAVQSKLGFEPFDEGEPNFHEASPHLVGKGFALVDMRMERWKPASKSWLAYWGGITVFADCRFFRDPLDQALKSTPVDEHLVALIKAIALLGIFGMKSLSAHLLERHESLLEVKLRTYWSALRRRSARPGILQGNYASWLAEPGDCW